MNSKIRTPLLIAALFTSSCGLDQQQEVDTQTKKQPIVHNSVDIITSSDPDFNVYEAKKLFAKAQEGTHANLQENNLKSAALNSRSSCLINAYPKVVVGDECKPTTNTSTGFIAGTGQATSYNTLITAHHVAKYDDERDIYQFGSFKDKSAWNQTPSAFGDDLWLRERLYRLGFNGLFGATATTNYSNPASVTFSGATMRDDIRNWKFRIHKDYYGTPSPDGKRRDMVMETTAGRCIDGVDIWVHGPGLFFDWVEPSRPELPAGFRHPSTGDLVYATSQNILASNQTQVYSNVALPGKVKFSNAVNCAPVTAGTQHACNPVSNYQSCAATTLDATRGSSGGGSLFFPTSTYGRGVMWGAIQGFYYTDKKYNKNNWGFGVGADQPYIEPNLSRAYTTNTVTSDNIVDDIEGERRGVGRNNGSSQPARNEASAVPNINDTVWIKPSNPGSPGPCIGRRCSNPPDSGELAFINCSTLYGVHFPEWAGDGNDYDFAGMGVGITGVPFYSQNGTVTTLGTMGMVCAPWSTYPYSEFWEYVGHNTVPGKFSQAWTHRSLGALDPIPFSHELTRNSITKKLSESEEAKTFPFQMCAPGYVLKGVKMRVLPEDVDGIEAGTLLGVSHIRCQKNYAHGPGAAMVDVPLKPSFNNQLASDMKIETLIGDVDESDDNFGAGQWIECSVQNEHVVGFEIDVNSNGGPPSYFSLVCSTKPPYLTTNLCARNEIGPLPGAPAPTSELPNPSCSTPAIFNGPTSNANNCP